MTQLDKNIAINLKRIRKSKNMSLDMLSDRTGVSKSMLGQIERGESNPTVSTIGKIVEGLKVPFEALLYDKKEILTVPGLEEAPVFKSREGEYSIHVLLPYEAGRSFEIYQTEMKQGARLISDSHGEQTWEYLTVRRGEVELVIGEERFLLKKDASLYFACDRAHTYRNIGEENAILDMLITTVRD